MRGWRGLTGVGLSSGRRCIVGRVRASLVLSVQGLVRLVPEERVELSRGCPRGILRARPRGSASLGIRGHHRPWQQLRHLRGRRQARFRPMATNDEGAKMVPGPGLSLALFYRPPNVTARPTERNRSSWNLLIGDTASMMLHT